MPRPAGRDGRPNPLLGLQQTAGNAATVAAMSAAGTSTAHGRFSTAALPTLVEQGAPELPPYLRDMEALGLSTAYGLTGDEFATATLADSVGRRDGVVAEIAAELAGRPESFYGSGRAFAVTGARGADRYDVTVRVSRADDDRHSLMPAPAVRRIAVRPGPRGAPAGPREPPPHPPAGRLRRTPSGALAWSADGPGGTLEGRGVL